MSLEVQIGGDITDLQKKIKEAEKELKEMANQKVEHISLGIDTKELSIDIKNAKKNLNDLRQTLKDTGNSFGTMAPKVANGGNALMQFSRIAQDAPFGIMGIGNNITATVESFNHLKQSTGSAGGALKAMASSIMGSGGILLGVSLLTSGLTYMSQKGLTVGDVFNKLTGRFDEFKKALSEVNAEAAKTAGSEASMMKGYVSAAQNVSLSMRDRLLAVKKLQDEYPAYFGNLSKEQILNGNVASAVKEATRALIAKAKAQGFANKVAELAEKEVPLREKETELITKQHNAVKELQRVRERLAKEGSSDRTRQQVAAATGQLKIYNDELKETQNQIRGILKEQNRWQDEVNKNVAIEIPTEYKTPSVKKLKKTKDVGADEIEIRVKPVLDLAMPKAFNIEDELNKQYQSVRFDPFASIIERMDKSRAGFIERLKSSFTPMSQALIDFNKGMNDLMKSSMMDTFGGIGDAIGQALANGTSVVESVGISLIASMGNILSSIGDKLIALGVASLLASTVFSTFGTALGVGAALAAIAGGVVLKAGGSMISKNAQKGGASGGGSNISAGNSVSSPTSTVNSGGGSSGFQNVVFEISGQSLVGVLSNTLNRNVKLGGTPAI